MTQQLYPIISKLRYFLKHHHPVIAISVISLLLAFAIYSLYEVLSITFLDPTSLQSAIQPFDKKTVTKIEQLHVANDTENQALAFPSPRVNPFVE